MTQHDASLNPDKNKSMHRYKVTAYSGHVYHVAVHNWGEALDWVKENFNTERGVRSIERKRGQVHLLK